MILENDTIAAISTAMSNSGIGIVRISGPDAVSILKRIFVPAKNKDFDTVPGYTIHYGNIVDSGKVVDEVLVMMMRAPHTYTREDTVEINCHGGVFVLGKVLEVVLSNGARAAEPGEFTKRAFVNGRIDLSQAEAVIDVINAENNFALRSAQAQLKGIVSKKIQSMRATLLEQIAYIEAALDDPEHIEMEGYGQTLEPVLRKLINETQELISSADDGRIIKEGIRTVILGKPNVGKSSLLNVLLGSDRAIVTDIAGTTRDVLEEHIRIKEISLNIVDTAGIRETDDVIEKIGVDKAIDSAKEADLVVWVVDGSCKLSEEDQEIAEIIKGRKAICLINKADLGRVVYPEEIEAEYGCPAIPVSILSHNGIDTFTSKIEEMFYNQELKFNDQVYITNARQKNALVSARNSLNKSLESVTIGMPEDFFTIDMMDAYEALGSVIGEAIEDDLADEIFAKFCMGK